MAAPIEKSSSTLFVRNLPYSATKEHLEEVFSDIGPVKKCFVITDTGVKDKCRGFGYVTFALREDADKAVTAHLSLAQRKLFISYSRRKDPRKKEKPKKDEDEENGFEIVKSTETETKDTKDETTGEDVVKQLDQSKAGEGKHEERKGRRNPRGKGREGEPGGEGKVGRLIIRNLAFQCSEEKLKKSFTRFGEIVEVHIPSDPKDSTKVRGYGFVQFSDATSAAEAIKEMNAKKLMGRPIAVDWAVSKEIYLKASKKKQPDLKKQQKPAEDSEEEEEDESDGESGVESSSEVEEMEEGIEDDNEEEQDEEEDEEVEEEDDEDADEDSDEEDEDSDEMDSEDEGVESKKSGKKTKKYQEVGQKKPRNISNDVGQGRTVFLRNLLFETSEAEIKEMFSQFGEITYSKIVVDPATEHPKGTAFVQFGTKESAEKCLQMANSSEEGEDGLELGGRKLLVSLAVPRAEASKLREVKKDQQKVLKKDKRNTYLLQEGFIRPGTQAAQGMTDADIAKRTKLEQIKRLKLQNINVFVSPTRLAIQNLPKYVDDKMLREAVLKAVDDKKARIIESRVMRDMKTPNAQGLCKSFGFAFCEFTKHEHALEALRKINNSTEFFGGIKRPIVGFSLENRLALETKKRRRDRSLLKAQQIQNMQKGKDGKTAVDGKQTILKSKALLSKKGVLPPPPSSKLEKRISNKTIPKHVGAKNRWRDKGKAEETKRQAKKKRQKELLSMSGRKVREPAKPKRLTAEGKPQKSRRNQTGRAEEAKFSKLVENYKHKLFNKEGSGQALKKSKWFEEG
ncbi:RNA-binding protein 28-like isoform X1 [Asterias rubens]|uniref:RNA-binding protein 28-like isoform X1 n=1 Tax=Asterias rubens TaxID=7604 RepID=UPI0014556487|nr:RNA-binding protein 28-like isoform X1 [Asterias rubens]